MKRFDFLLSKRYRIFHLTLLILIILMLLIPIFVSNAIHTIINNIRIKPLSNKIIVIDPGHGGIDGGTNRGDILEKNINLEVGLKLKDLLTKKGATVVMTRETDISLDDRIVGNGSRHREDLNTRARIINENNADVYLSIHVNASKNEKKMGPIVFFHEDSEVGKILAEHMQEYLNNISTYKKKDFDINHNIMSGSYFIAANTTAPGIIIEMGFITNETDRKILLDADHQDEIVEQITKGIISYFNDQIDTNRFKLILGS